jgi:site-specific recombinase XerD
MAGELTSFSLAKEKFINYLKNQKRSISTILAYGKDIEQLSEFLEGRKITQVSSVLSEHLEAFKEELNKKGYTAKSISRKLNSIKTFYRFLKSEGLIKEDPAAPVSHPKYETKAPRVLSKMEYRALRDACRDDIRIAAIVELMLQTGIRIGEVARLELNDVKDNDLLIRPYESQPERSLPLNKAVRTALDDYFKERPKTRTKAVFVTKTGHPLLVRNIRTSIDRYFRLAGIEKTKVNDLRNTWIAHHLMAGTSVVILSKLAGHKRLSTTERYLQFAEEKTEGKKIKLEEL